MKRNLRPAQRGVVILMFGALLVFVLAPAVGLAIDVGVAYAMKARLQSAADGAAIAATRSLGRGQSQAARQIEAENTANKFFAANMQTAWTGIANPVATVTFPTDAPPKTTMVQLAASVEVPTYFMRLLGSNSMTLRTVSRASRRDVNIMLVIDRSGSLESSGSCPALREAVKSFAITFQDGRDKVGMVTYGTTYNVDQRLRTNFRTGSVDVVTHIDNINCTGWTNSAAAYSLAYDQLVAANDTGVLNAILFFTDGQPNTVTMPRFRMTGAGCSSTGNRFGIIAGGDGTPGAGAGIFSALPHGAPPVLSDSDLIGNTSGCAFASSGSLDDVTPEVFGLSRATADGDTGNGSGEDGYSQGGDSGGHGNGPHGSGLRWNNWPGNWDAFGNALDGWKSLTVDADGRFPMTAANVLNSGINALDNAAARVRTDSVSRGLDVVTYVIGLGNFTGAPELELLNRVANTPASTAHDPTQPIGLMIYATDSGQLEAAFSQIGSEMLRLAM